MPTTQARGSAHRTPVVRSPSVTAEIWASPWRRVRLRASGPPTPLGLVHVGRPRRGEALHITDGAGRCACGGEQCRWIATSWASGSALCAACLIAAFAARPRMRVYISDDGTMSLVAPPELVVVDETEAA